MARQALTNTDRSFAAAHGLVCIPRSPVCVLLLHCWFRCVSLEAREPEKGGCVTKGLELVYTLSAQPFPCSPSLEGSDGSTGTQLHERQVLCEDSMCHWWSRAGCLSWASSSWESSLLCPQVQGTAPSLSVSSILGISSFLTRSITFPWGPSPNLSLQAELPSQTPNVLLDIGTQR